MNEAWTWPLLFAADAAWTASLETWLRLLLALVGGAVIGWEREMKSRPAGLRTHMLVSFGAAIFMVSTMELLARDGSSPSDSGRFDATRVLAGVAQGVGFLGAGAILKGGHSIRGLTTAASIWVAAAIGATCGLGQLDLAIGCVVAAVLVLGGLGRLEIVTSHFGRRKPKRDDGENSPNEIENSQS